MMYHILNKEALILAVSPCFYVLMHFGMGLTADGSETMKDWRENASRNY